MKLSRLSGRKNVERVRNRGTVWRGKAMKITYVQGAPRGKPEGMYVGTQASTKLHPSAVKRNRMRRRSREALRLVARKANSQRTLPSCQLILVPKSSSLTCDFVTLLQDCEAFFTHLAQHAR
jgi:ribonuclease P protein component